MEILNFKEDYFICSNKGNLYKFSYEDLLVLECDKPFVCFCMKEKKFFIQKTLSFVREYLKEYFIQINRQTIINIKHVDSLIYEQSSCWIIMINNERYKVSERRKKEVRDAFICIHG